MRNDPRNWIEVTPETMAAVPVFDVPGEPWKESDTLVVIAKSPPRSGYIPKPAIGRVREFSDGRREVTAHGFGGDWEFAYFTTLPDLPPGVAHARQRD